MGEPLGLIGEEDSMVTPRADPWLRPAINTAKQARVFWTWEFGWEPSPA